MGWSSVFHALHFHRYPEACNLELTLWSCDTHDDFKFTNLHNMLIIRRVELRAWNERFVYMNLA